MRDEKAETSLVRIVIGAHIGTPVQIALFHAQAIDGPVPDVCNTKLSAGITKRLIDVTRELLGHMQLPPKFTNIGYTNSKYRRVADLNLSALHVREAIVGDVIRCYLL